MKNDENLRSITLRSIVTPPSTVAVVKAVGWVTFLEIISDRILYNVILCSFMLFGIGFLASRLTFVRPDRVILDFGLSALAISSAMIAVFTGSGLLGKEIERRTIHVALTHPISRGQFILGKFAGLAGVIFVNWVLLSAIYLGILWMNSGADLNWLSSTLGIALFLILVQSMVISSICILFSSFSTTSLAVIISIGFYLIGNNISQLRALATKLESPVGKFVLNSISTALPNLEVFSLGNKVTYGLPVTGQFVGSSVLYGFFMIALLLTLAGVLIQHREV